MPRPVEEDRLQILGAGCGRKWPCVAAEATTTAAAASAACRCLRRTGTLSARRCRALGTRCSCALAARRSRALTLGQSRLYLTHRDERREHTYRERASINHR